MSPVCCVCARAHAGHAHTHSSAARVHAELRGVAARGEPGAGHPPGVPRRSSDFTLTLSRRASTSGDGYSLGYSFKKFVTLKGMWNSVLARPLIPAARFCSAKGWVRASQAASEYRGLCACACVVGRREAARSRACGFVLLIVLRIGGTRARGPCLCPAARERLLNAGKLPHSAAVIEGERQSGERAKQCLHRQLALTCRVDGEERFSWGCAHAG